MEVIVEDHYINAWGTLLLLETTRKIVDDAVFEGTVLLMESDYEKPINIGSERLVTIDELAGMIIKISGKRITKKYDLSTPQGSQGKKCVHYSGKKDTGMETKSKFRKGWKKHTGG